ncbi:MAG: hypothetical protein MJZ90_03005 [Bacteroidales bacterium]|nr:hypothetical protein [Bacteroidales bacterium]MCQ2322591.1 hypothetical protein [Bacteroidales bacterium]
MRIEPNTTLKCVADFIGATKMIGDPNFVISGLNEIHEVEAGDITFVDHPKYYNKALDSAASTIIINTDKVECPEGKALLVHDCPFDAFNKLVLSYRRFEPATAMVSPKAEIGEGTIIEPGAFVAEHVKIGRNCIIHANVTIYNHVVIGDNVIIQSGSVIGADACYFQRRKDGFVKFESCGRVVIEDDVEIGALCAVDIGVTSDTIVGKGTKTDNHVQVGHDAKIGKYCFLGAHCAIGGVSRIKDNVSVWSMSAVNKDLVIAEGTTVLAYTAVDKDTEPNTTYFGIPADEARKKWKEMAIAKMLPDMVKNMK